MKKPLLLTAGCALFILASPSLSQADEVVRSAQATLKTAGFYTGPVNGELDTETRGALKRYQIRNQLEPTGELTPETRTALTQENQENRTGSEENRPPAPPTPSSAAPSTAPHFPAPPGSNPFTSPAHIALFQNTPYETAPLEIQTDILRKAQAQLREQRLYPGPINGLPSSEFSTALLRLQTQRNLPRTGRLDTDTLALLHLLPIRKVGRPHGMPQTYVPRPPAGRN